MTSLMLGWILLAGTVSVESLISVEGTVGGTVMFTCSHSIAGDNVKYFCKDPCLVEDILIESDWSPRGRYTLQDLGNGDFIVKIKDLQIPDSGTYWCGVERFIKDTYKEVRLTVKEATSPAPPRTSTPTTSTRRSISSPPRSSIQTVSTTISNSTHRTTTPPHLPPPHQDRSASGNLLYIAAGLVGLIIVLLISLIVCCRFKKKKDSEQKFNSVYEDVKVHQTEERKPSGAALRRVSSTEGMYSNVLPLQNMEHTDNPLYNTREQFMTVYSTVK